MDNVDGQRGWLEGFQQHHQPALSDRVGDYIREQPSDACSRQARIEYRFHRVDYQSRANGHGHDTPADRKLPRSRIRDAHERDAIMRGEVRRRFRTASAAYIVGTRTNNIADRPDLPCDQAAIRQGADADSEIDVVFLEV